MSPPFWNEWIARFNPGAVVEDPIFTTNLPPAIWHYTDQIPEWILKLEVTREGTDAMQYWAESQPVIPEMVHEVVMHREGRRLRESLYGRLL